jgi:hypothetical protein
MRVQIQRQPSGATQVVIGRIALDANTAKVIRPALLRHITELSAAIEAAATNSVAEGQRGRTIRERRRTFRLLEHFDMVVEEVNSVQAWLGVQSTHLTDHDIELFTEAMRWFRNQWAEKDTDEYAAADRILHLLDAL